MRALYKKMTWETKIILLFFNLEGPNYRIFFGLQKIRVSYFLNHFLRLVIIYWLRSVLNHIPFATWLTKEHFFYKKQEAWLLNMVQTSSGLKHLHMNT